MEIAICNFELFHSALLVTTVATILISVIIMIMLTIITVILIVRHKAPPAEMEMPQVALSAHRLAASESWERQRCQSTSQVIQIQWKVLMTNQTTLGISDISQMIVLTVVTSAHPPYIINIMISWNHNGLLLTLEPSCLINMMRSWAISEDSPRWPDQYFWEWFHWRSATMFTLPSLWQDFCLVNSSYHPVSTLQAM